MELATLRFLGSAPAALAVGLLLLPRLTGEDGARWKPAVALLALARTLFGFFLLVGIARNIVPAERPIDASALIEFTFGTVVGKAWVVTQAVALVFTALAAARLIHSSAVLDRLTLWAGVAVIAVVSVTGHAIDDSLPLYAQLSFPAHTAAGLTWLGGLLGLAWWMLTARGKPPEEARRLAERWSLVAKIAMLVVLASGLLLAWDNIGSFPNLLATPYGRLLIVKLSCLLAALLLALSLARYLTVPSAGFDTAWYGRVGAIEAGFGLALLFLAGWIAVINPAAHETDLYWPLPFRISYKATWGQKVPAFSDIWWWGVAALVLALGAITTWFTPALRDKRRLATPAAAAGAFVCLMVSLSTQAYPETYDDPTVPYTAESIERGYVAFQGNCVACHGAWGEANGPMAKDLKVPPADLTAAHVGTHTLGDIFHWLSFGGQSGVMPAFSEQLGVDDRWDVINFLSVLSTTNRSRFIGPKGIIQWLVAPDFALTDPKEQETSLEKLRGTPVLISFANCGTGAGAARLVASSSGPGEAEAAASAADPDPELVASLNLASETAKSSGARHVTIYQGACPADASARLPTHPKSVEVAYSVLNRYLDEPFSVGIPEGHFLVDRSGYIRARFKHFAQGDGNIAALRAQIALTASEPIVTINLHEH